VPTVDINHPRSNNFAVHSMGPIADGGRNWIHAGSTHAGPKIAVITIRGLNRAVSPAQIQLLATRTVKLRLR
jgi:hypothetical protein